MKLKTWVESKHGRASALAKSIGVPQSFVSKMVNGIKPVPLEQCVPIERFTDGEVTCEEMRPDKTADFAYLRGLEPELAPAQEPRARVAIETVAAESGV